jgi:hypothetical protein
MVPHWPCAATPRAFSSIIYVTTAGKNSIICLLSEKEVCVRVHALCMCASMCVCHTKQSLLKYKISVCFTTQIKQYGLSMYELLTTNKTTTK